MNPALFREVSLGELVLPNRIAVSPMAQYSGVNGVAQPWHIQHLGSFAVSGPGLVIIESTAVEPPGYGSAGCLALHNDEQEAGLRRVIDALRGFSKTRLGIQLGHSGRKASTALPSAGGKPLLPSEGGWEICAPSALSYGKGWPTPTALDADGLKRVREAYVQAAVRSARLGLDLIEVHGAHGYLLHSFLSPISNQRSDQYGGTPQKRLRFVQEVIAGIREVWARPRALGIRLNSCDWLDGGLDVDDTVEIASALKEAGCDYISVSSGAISDQARIAAKPGYLAPFSAEIRRRAGIATMVTGLIFDPALANQIVDQGQADAVAIARAFLDNPRWVWHAAEELGAMVEYPMQYERSQPDKWPGAKALRSSSRAAA